MAVYTDLSNQRYRKHLSQIGEVYGLNIIDIQGMEAGTADSKFVLTAADLGTPLVLTIHETADISPAAKTSSQIKRMLHYVSYLSSASDSVVDRAGKSVNLKVLEPLAARSAREDPVPYLGLDFDGVEKIISIVQFVEGTSYKNDPEVLPSLEETRRAGRALAGLSSLAQKYPAKEIIDPFNFADFTTKIKQISEEEQALLRLGLVLSSGRNKGETALVLGVNYINSLMSSGSLLLKTWSELNADHHQQNLPIIHGDLFIDNTMMADDGRFILLDFGESSRSPLGLDIGIALTSWASKRGQAVRTNILAFLEGFDAVVPLSKQQIGSIPAFVQIGAFRWETFRIERIVTQDAEEYEMLSPEEFSSIRCSWRKLEQPFLESSSLTELKNRIVGSPSS